MKALIVYSVVQSEPDFYVVDDPPDWIASIHNVFYGDEGTTEDQEQLHEQLCMLLIEATKLDDESPMLIDGSHTVICTGIRGHQK